MEKERLMRLWFMTFAAIGAIASLVSLANGDFKNAIIAFAAAMVAAIISWVYINELLYKSKKITNLMKQQ